MLVATNGSSLKLESDKRLRWSNPTYGQNWVEKIRHHLENEHEIFYYSESFRSVQHFPTLGSA